LAEAGGLANDAGDEIIITRPVPEMTFGQTEPPPIDTPSKTPNSPEPDQKSPLKGSTASPDSTAGAAEPPELPKADNSTAKPAAGANSSTPGTDTLTVNLNELMETGNMKNNIVLQAGDVVTVPHAGIVYVLGAVGRPGGFVLTNDREQMTTLKILALAGGFTPTAKSSHAVVIRKDAQGKQHEVDVDLKKIRNRQAEDLQLQPSDILYVPESGAKAALFKSVEFGIALGSGVALYRLAYR